MSSSTAVSYRPHCCPAHALKRPVATPPAVTLRQLEATIAEHHPRLLAIAHRYFDCDADCSDAVQDACLAAVRHLPGFRGGCQLQTWLYRIVINACLMKLRRQARQRTAALEAAPQSEPQAPEDDGLAGEERRQLVRHALCRLSQSQRTVIQLRYFERFSTEETAELLGVHAAVVKTRLHRSCRALGRLLKDAGDWR